MGKKIVTLILETILRATVIILGIATVVMLVLFIKTTIKNKKSKAEVAESNNPITTEVGSGSEEAGSGDTSEEPSSEDTTEAVNAPADSKDAKILIINGSKQAGVAGKWKEELMAEGYNNIEVGNYLLDVVQVSEVHVSGAYDGQDLKDKLSLPESGTVDELSPSAFDSNPYNYDIVVIIGKNDVK